MQGPGPGKQKGRGALGAQGSRAGMLERTRWGPLFTTATFAPPSSPDIQTLYSGIGRWGVVSLVAGEQEP